jgi:hypothetical protein
MARNSTLGNRPSRRSCHPPTAIAALDAHTVGEIGLQVPQRSVAGGMSS